MRLLEREVGLRTLTTALHKSSTGEGRVVLVCGEAGIGKTTLIRYFVDRHSTHVRVRWGGCDALFTPRPFGPLYDMASDIGGDLPELLTLEDKRSQIFSTVFDDLQRHITITVFEDVHWADEATLDLLVVLCRRITHTNALLIISYRDDELHMRHPLRVLLGSLAGHTAVQHIALAPLSEHSVRQLIGSLTIDAHALHHLTGGNPFFVTEVLTNPDGSIPNSVHDAVLGRIIRLSPAAQKLLGAAAVIGPRIEPWLLAMIAGDDAHATDECLVSGILVQQNELLGFRHELIRQIIKESIAPMRLLTLHQATFQALTTSPTTRSDLARLVHHAAAANDHTSVSHYAPAAARAASIASTHHTAVALYALAFRYAADLPLEQQAQMYDEYSVECDVTNQRDEAIVARRKAVELWRQAANLPKCGESQAALALLHHLVGDRIEADRANRVAIDLLEAQPPGAGLIKAYNMQALLALANQDGASGVTLAERAIRLAQQLANTTLMPRLYETLGLCWIYLDAARGCAYLEQSLSLAHKLGQTMRVANTYANLSSIYVEFYEFERAKAYFRDGIAYAVEHDLDFARIFMQGWQTIMLVQQGQWKDAAQLIDSIIQRHEPSPGRGPALIALGRLRARRGEPGAIEALDEALDLSIKLGFRQREGMIRAARAEASWLGGDYQRTLDEARAVYDIVINIRHPWASGELTYWRCLSGESIPAPPWVAQPWALQISGDWQAAATCWQELGCPYEQAQALANGDIPARLVALEIFERLGAWPAADSLRQSLRRSGVRNVPRKARQATRENPFLLTPRELNILDLLSEGLSNAMIAERLVISPKTVDHHVSAVLSKLHVHSREEAAELARQHHLFHKNRESY